MHQNEGSGVKENSHIMHKQPRSGHPTNRKTEKQTVSESARALAPAGPIPLYSRLMLVMDLLTCKEKGEKAVWCSVTGVNIGGETSRTCGPNVKKHGGKAQTKGKTQPHTNDKVTTTEVKKASKRVKKYAQKRKMCGAAQWSVNA